MVQAVGFTDVVSEIGVWFKLHNTALIPTCSLFQCFVNQSAASLPAACFCALLTGEQHPYITFFSYKFLSL